jgi:Holliday junction DNA helicase RuvA
MIAWLTGKLQNKAADSVIINVGGVGYQVAVPVSTLNAIAGPGEDVTLHIHTHVREDSLSLYGFGTELEKDVFLLLIGISGIGPKLALAVLSGLSVQELVAAIRSSDDPKLCSIPGIGKKTAARMCLELKDKVLQVLPAESPTAPRPAGASPGIWDDAVSALVNLGYKRQVAEDAVNKAQQGRPEIPIEELVREALSILRKR